MMNFSFYILGEKNQIQELIDIHKKAVEELSAESAESKKHPLTYLILGIFFFMIWYIFKLFTN